MQGRFATVAVNQFIFKQAVSVSDLLSFYATVERIGNTSVTVHVEVYAERNPANLQVVKVTEANLTYVAIDHEGKPRPVPRDRADLKAESAWAFAPAHGVPGAEAAVGLTGRRRFDTAAAH